MEELLDEATASINLQNEATKYMQERVKYLVDEWHIQAHIVGILQDELKRAYLRLPN